MRNLLWQLYFLLSSWLGFSQSIQSEIVAELPSQLNECSGMVFIDQHRMVMINDGGNDPELFIIDTAGQLLEIVELPELQNIDWESLAIGGQELFICDVGNNNNRRRDLSIYVLNIHDWSLKRQLKFYYPEQSGFPPEDDDLYYDLESVLFRNDSLLLFTKNRTEPFDGQLRLYYLDPNKEEQAATLLKTIDMKGGLMQLKWVCGAENGLQENDVLLLGYRYLWYFPKLGVSGASESTYLRYDLGYFSQKEALAVQYPYLYFTEESHFTRPGKLHRAKIDFFSEYNPKIEMSAHLLDKHFKDSLTLSFDNPAGYEGVSWIVYAKDGSIAQSDTISNANINEGTLKLDLKGLAHGSHILSVEHRTAKQVFIIYKD